ncbi:MAG: CDP-glucose 4,6-dehydratase [Verrucomicrobiaceae bacterium]|nr:CDP-glucose 4,6-dehydratase [Verrucomicrobiaceae bacterium]
MSRKKVLVTGHTGFKGSWLSLWLHALGAKVSGFALAPLHANDLKNLIPGDCFEHEWLADLRDRGTLEQAIATVQPDLILHLAAQPLVRLSYQQPLETFAVNAWGTALLLEAVRVTRCGAPVVVVTSDKCYVNRNQGRPFSEDDPLGGHDVYSMSKAAAELVVAAWHASFFSREAGLGRLATVRAGNVIGGGDYAVDRILPDCVRAQIAGDCVILRNPAATRPWQHVLECLSGYLQVGQQLMEQPQVKDLLNLNFGPDPESERTVGEVVEAFFSVWPGKWEVRPDPNAVPEAVRLTLSHEKAKTLLGWRPVWSFQDATRATAEWYRARHQGGTTDMLAFTQLQIMQYAEQARLAGLAWTK